jgi:hypothetical protein
VGLRQNPTWWCHRGKRDPREDLGNKTMIVLISFNFFLDTSCDMTRALNRTLSNCWRWNQWNRPLLQIESLFFQLELTVPQVVFPADYFLVYFLWVSGLIGNRDLEIMKMSRSLLLKKQYFSFWVLDSFCSGILQTCYFMTFMTRSFNTCYYMTVTGLCFFVDHIGEIETWGQYITDTWKK